MITWLQNVTQKHNRSLFTVLLVIIIIAFVFTIGDFGGPGIGSSRRVRKETFFGYDLADGAVMSRLQRETYVSMTLNQDNRIYQKGGLQSALSQRMVLLSLADEHSIPYPSSQKDLEAFIKTLPALQNPQTGAFDFAALQRMRDRVATEAGDSKLLDRVVYEDYRIDLIRRMLAGPGYIVRKQAEIALNARETRWDLYVAELNKSAFQPIYDLSEGVLAEFYTTVASQFDVPAHVEAAAVLFNAADFASSVQTPSDKDLESHYQANLSRWEVDAEKKTKPFADVREAVLKDAIKERSEALAIEAASTLTADLYDATYSGKVKTDRASLEGFLSSKGLKLGWTGKVSTVNPTDDGPFSAPSLRFAASLNERSVFSDAVTSKEGAAVFIYLSTLPSAPQPLAAVRTEVENLLKEQQKNEQLSARGKELAEALRATVSEKGNFETKASELGLTWTKRDTYALGGPLTGDRMRDYYLTDTLRGLKSGEVSDMIVSGDTGVFLYVVEKRLPDSAGKPEAVENMLNELKPMSARATPTVVVANLIAQANEQAAREDEASKGLDKVE